MSSEDVTRRQAPPHLLQEDEKEALRELKATGKLVAALVILSYMYGDLTVARQLTPDPRQHSWLLMTSPLPTIVACLLYVAIVTWWGPRYMSTRKPVSNLRNVMMAYNAFQVIFSARLFWESGMGGWFGSYSILCQRCDFSDNPQAVRMVHAGYWYLISKFLDFTDTVFFVVHKKNKHISLLHVFHHALMPVCMWYGIRYYAGGHTTLMFLLNSFVHTVMYSYYLLAAMGPRVRPFLWWKKYLTTLQMVQFVMMFIHAALTIVTGCPVGIPLMRVILALAFIFLILFLDFYIKAYRHKAKRKVQGSMTCIPELSSVYGKKHDPLCNGQLKESAGISNAAAFNKSFTHQNTAGDNDQHNVRSRQHAD